MVHKLIPAYQFYPWGGKRLKADYGKSCEEDIIAESWELSCHEDGLTKLAETGELLCNYVKRSPDVLGKRFESAETFPIMVKLIDAAKNLSLQVHPDDAYSMKNERQLGKTEWWYVVDCDPGAYILYGLKRDVAPDELEASLKLGTVAGLMNKVSVHKGDSFLIEAGTLHAVGAGCLIAEVQENSNITYRVFDYGRKNESGKSRQLHIKQATEVADHNKLDVRQQEDIHLAQCDYFTVDSFEISGSAMFSVPEETFAHILVTEGRVSVNAQESFDARQGDSFFAESSTKDIELYGKGTVLITYAGRVGT